MSGIGKVEGDQLGTSKRDTMSYANIQVYSLHLQQMGEVVDDLCHLVCMEFFWPRFTTKEGTQNIGFMCGLLPIGLINAVHGANRNQYLSICFNPILNWENDPLGTALYLSGGV